MNETWNHTERGAAGSVAAILWTRRTIGGIVRVRMSQPASYLILFNIAKKQNFGNLIRTAQAFGVKEVLTVGRKGHHVFGAFGTARTTARRHFYDLTEARAFLVEQGATLCGVEIMPSAEPIDTRPFRGDTAFMVGNEGTGLSAAQRALCDQFVYIRQHGDAACLNVNVAAGIVLHHFAAWAELPEAPRRGEQFGSTKER